MSKTPEYDIQFELVNEKSGSTLELTYRLFDRDFSRRWLKLFKRALDNRVKVQDDGVFYGAALIDEDTCVADMTNTVNNINNYIEQNGLKEHHIELEPHKGMSQEFLNDMHRRFEVLRHEKGFEDNTVQKNLANLNTVIHQCERFLSDAFQGCHIEINFEDVEYGEFKKEDYELFTPDKKFGYLYLTYGVTGVPVEAAFYAKPKDKPLPQPNYCSGCFMYFSETCPFPFWDELEAWLKETWGWNVKDPKLAIGYIPLGELIIPEDSWETVESWEKMVQQIAEHQKIRNIRLLPRDDVFSENGASGFLHNILEKFGLKKKASLSLF